MSAGETLVSTGGMDSDTDWTLVRCGYSFFIGVLAFSLSSRIAEKSQYLALLSTGLSIAPVVFVGHFPRVLIPWTYASTIVLLSRMPADSGASMMLGSRPLIHLGTIS